MGRTTTGFNDPPKKASTTSGNRSKAILITSEMAEKIPSIARRRRRSETSKTKTKRALKEIEKGEMIEILVDDPAANLDLKHFCEVSGNNLIKISKIENNIHCLIQKT